MPKIILNLDKILQPLFEDQEPIINNDTLISAINMYKIEHNKDADNNLRMWLEKYNDIRNFDKAKTIILKTDKNNMTIEQLTSTLKKLHCEEQPNETTS